MVESTYRGFVPLDRRGGSTILIHTDAVRIAAETGTVGLAAWLAILIAIALTAVRVARRADDGGRIATLVASSAIVVILFASQFAGRFYTEPYLWLAVGTLLGLNARAWLPQQTPVSQVDEGARPA